MSHSQDVPEIDPRAIIHPSARLGENVSIGPWTTIGADVSIGDNTRISSHCVIKGPCEIGAYCEIFQFSTIGEATPALAFNGESTSLEIGDRNIIREGVTIHRGTVQDAGKTIIGDDNLFMAYVHIGHDCVLGNHIIMANNASVSGHVKVGDYANFGGYSGIPQFRSIGAHAFIGGMALVVKDVPACVSVSGNPARAAGINREGLRRRGIPDEQIDEIKQLYRIVYRQGRSSSDAIALGRDSKPGELGNLFLDSVEQSQFGITRGRE